MWCYDRQIYKIKVHYPGLVHHAVIFLLSQKIMRISKKNKLREFYIKNN